MDEKLIDDVSPLSPPDSKDLKSYALTLPIFEMTDQSERIEWVTRSGLRIESIDELFLVGDGAQDDVAIQRLSTIDSPLQKIRVTIAGQADGPDRIYDLVRVPGGWKRLGMRREGGASNAIGELSGPIAIDLMSELRTKNVKISRWGEISKNFSKLKVGITQYEVERLLGRGFVDPRNNTIWQYIPHDFRGGTNGPDWNLVILLKDEMISGFQLSKYIYGPVIQ